MEGVTAGMHQIWWPIVGQLTLQARRVRGQHFCWCTILHGLLATVPRMAAIEDFCSSFSLVQLDLCLGRIHLQHGGEASLTVPYLLLTAHVNEDGTAIFFNI